MSNRTTMKTLARWSIEALERLGLSDKTGVSSPEDKWWQAISVMEEEILRLRERIDTTADGKPLRSMLEVWFIDDDGKVEQGIVEYWNEAFVLVLIPSEGNEVATLKHDECFATEAAAKEQPNE